MRCISWFPKCLIFAKLLLIAGLLQAHGEDPGAAGLSERILVFQPGMPVGDYTVSRTFQPSFTVLGDGTVLVFCQGRLDGGWDDDPKVILMNRSTDSGRTWEGMRAISAPMNHFAMSAYTYKESGVEKVGLMVSVDLKETRDTYADPDRAPAASPGFELSALSPDTPTVLLRLISRNQGDDWEIEVLQGDRSPVGREVKGYVPAFINMIGQVQKVETGPYAGRIFTSGPVYGEPADVPITPHFRNHPVIGSAVFYSDDNGASWEMDGLVADYLGNESSAVLVNGGEELLMVRRMNLESKMEKRPAKTDYRPGFGHRIFQTSSDWGANWSGYRSVPVSGVPCHGTLSRVGERLYFSIPQGYGPDVEKRWDAGREQGTIYFSDDDGATWKYRVIEPGSFAYSAVGKLSESERICFYARGNLGEDGLAARIFTDAWLDADPEFASGAMP